LLTIEMYGEKQCGIKEAMGISLLFTECQCMIQPMRCLVSRSVM